MLDIKTRKVGSSVVISIPSQFQVPVGEEYVAYKAKNGSLIFSPKLSNPFLSDQNFEPVEDDLLEKAMKEIENKG